MTYDVVVCGAGPVGLMLAAELRVRGVSTLVLEHLAEPSNTIKAGSINVPTAEALYRRGLLPEIREIQEQAQAKMLEFFAKRQAGPAAGGAPPAPPKPRAHFAGLWKLDPTRLDPADLPDAPVGSVMLIPQQPLEYLLAEHAERLGVEVRRGYTVTGLHDDGDGVDVTFDGPGGSGRVRAGYLVGCDGGRSTVRKAAGFAFDGTDPVITGHQAIATLEGAEELQSGWHRTPTGLMVYGPVPGRVLTVEYDGPPAERDTPVTVEELQASIRRVSGVDVTVTGIQSVTRFTDNARQVPTYRIGRVLLAGDAAHVHSPFGGQGLNLGVQDAVNLGWKLAATVQGHAPDDLLDTYTTEQHPIGARVLDVTRAQVALLRPDAHTTALRTFVSELMDLDAGNRYFTKMISGLWIRHELGDGHPLVGARTPDPELTGAEGVERLGDLCHDGRPVLLDLADSAKLRETADGWSDRVRIATARAPERDDLAALLVRPDGFVAWAASADTEPDLDTLRTALTRWFGAEH